VRAGDIAASQEGIELARRLARDDFRNLALGCFLQGRRRLRVVFNMVAFLASLVVYRKRRSLRLSSL
jgi:hypothetical protein